MTTRSEVPAPELSLAMQLVGVAVYLERHGELPTTAEHVHRIARRVGKLEGCAFFATANEVAECEPPALTPQAREVDALSQHPVAVLSRYAGHLEDCASHADAEEIACSCGYVDAWNAVFSRSALTPPAGEMGAVGDLLALGAATVFGRPGHP